MAKKKNVKEDIISGVEIETYFEFNGIQINSEEMIEKAREAYLAEGNDIKDVKSVKIYINANERRLYYVVNGKAENKFIEF